MIHLLTFVNPAAAQGPFEWASQHIQAIGWPVLLFCAWKVRGYFERFSNQATKTIGQIDTLATNHFPHMEKSLQKQDRLLHSVDASLRQMAGREAAPLEVDDIQEA